jgi:hypothetical protein
MGIKSWIREQRFSLGRWSCLLLVGWLPVCALGLMLVVGRLRGSHRARRTTVQPAQLSLMPEQIPAPPPVVIVSLPETGVAAAIRIVARLIASAAATTMTGVGDE